MKTVKLTVTLDKYGLEDMDSRVFNNTIADQILNGEIFGRTQDETPPGTSYHASYMWGDPKDRGGWKLSPEQKKVRSTSHKIAGCIIDAYAEVYPNGIDIWRFGFGLERLSIGGCFDLKKHRLEKKEDLTKRMVRLLEQQKKEYKVKDGTKRVGQGCSLSMWHFKA